MILAAALAVQVALAPGKLEGVPGEARCGSRKVWEDRAAKPLSVPAVKACRLRLETNANLRLYSTEISR